jgi:hypothetical protein
MATASPGAAPAPSPASTCWPRCGRAAGHLERFGGHAAAAGFDIRTDAIEAFRAAFEEQARRMLPDEPVPELRIDLDLTLAEVTPQLVRYLAYAGPFGLGNPTPVFALRGVVVQAAAVVGRTASTSASGSRRRSAPRCRPSASAWPPPTDAWPGRAPSSTWRPSSRRTSGRGGPGSRPSWWTCGPPTDEDHRGPLARPPPPGAAVRHATHRRPGPGGLDEHDAARDLRRPGPGPLRRLRRPRAREPLPRRSPRHVRGAERTRPSGRSAPTSGRWGRGPGHRGQGGRHEVRAGAGARVVRPGPGRPAVRLGGGPGPGRGLSPRPLRPHPVDRTPGRRPCRRRTADTRRYGDTLLTRYLAPE